MKLKIVISIISLLVSSGLSSMGSSQGSADLQPQREQAKQAPVSAQAAAPVPIPKGFDKAMQFLLPVEGGCQSWKNDRGNYYIDPNTGKRTRGHTCMGIIPNVALKYGVHPTKLKPWYESDRQKFKQWAYEIYRKDYWNPIGADNLPEPLDVVCFDVAVNSGTGRCKEFLRKTENYKNPKQRAIAVNELHLKYYQAICRNKKSQCGFLKGWTNRYKDRKRFIERE